MANNPLDLREFKHYLNFKNDDIGRIQISEPVKFDGSEFVIQQDTSAYARDISYMNEEIDLEFYKGFFEPSDETYELPNGFVVDKLGHAIEFLFEYNNTYGFQSEIEYILERNGLEFIVGELNFEGSKTDELTYFYCKVVQNTKRALSKRREDTKLNGFATEDLDGNPITPLQTTNMLLKAKPVVQISEWQYAPSSFSITNNGFQQFAGFPLFNNILKSEIANTSTSFSTSYDAQITVQPAFLEQYREDISIIIAQTDLIDVKVSISNLSFTSNATDTVGTIKELTVNYGSSYVSGEFDTVTLESTSDDVFNLTNASYEVTIPFVPSGGFIYIHYYMLGLNPSGGGAIGTFGFTQTSGDLQITATNLGIDTVIKAVRYGDLLRYSLKAINQMEIIGEDFDSGGKFYDLFAFSGNLIRQRDDVPFYFTFKDRRENLALMNADVQINEDNAFAIRYDKFYDNVDNGAFLTIPNKEFNTSYNQRYSVNLLEYIFKNYEKDRDEANTLDSVHTEAQFSINNTKVKNTKKIEVNDIFDVFSIESQRRQQFKETTALDGDDKIHCMDAVPLAPSSRGGFTTLMRHNATTSGTLQLLKDSELPSWGLIGVSVGGSFTLENTDNAGEYTIFSIENAIITLTPISVVPVSLDELSTEVSFPFDNVSYVNRTNEGFDLIENVLNPDNFGNLKYTIRRNLIDWEAYISTCATYISENPKNTEFKNNGELVTQFDGGEIYTENGDIDLTTIQEAILSPKIVDIDVIAEFDTVLDLISKYQTITNVGGFIRVEGNSGEVKKLYPQKLSYTWATKVLNIIGEQRKEADTVTISKIGSIIYIDEVGYEQSELDEVIFEVNGEYFAIYDVNKIKIINFTKYSKFIVQEETFDNPTDLAQALIDL